MSKDGKPQRRRAVPCKQLPDGTTPRIEAGKHRHLQIIRQGKRKLFKGRVQQTFLEWFAATSNASLSAKMAGICYQTVFKHRMKSPEFAEAWDRALEQGYARIEAKLLEQKAKGEPIRIDGDLVAPETEEIDPQIAMHLLREHKRSIGGRATPFGVPRKGGARVRVATNAEVTAALSKLLLALQKRLDRRAEAERRGKAAG